MPILEKVHDLWEHVFWADMTLLPAVLATEDSSPEAVREYAHVIGAEEVWLARLQNRSSRFGVWPAVSCAALPAVVEQTHAGWRTFLAARDDDDLGDTVTYTNSAGQTFTTPVADILLHVPLHGQYHRGKINLLLRQAGRQPAPTDYITFVRGVSAATEEAARRSRGSG